MLLPARSQEDLVCRHEMGEHRRDELGGNFVTGLPRERAASKTRRRGASAALLQLDHAVRRSLKCPRKRSSNTSDRQSSATRVGSAQFGLSATCPQGGLPDTDDPQFRHGGHAPVAARGGCQNPSRQTPCYFWKTMSAFLSSPKTAWYRGAPKFPAPGRFGRFSPDPSMIIRSTHTRAIA